MSTVSRGVDRKLHPKLEPLLIFELQEGWTRRILLTKTECLGVGFRYRENRQMSVWMSYMDWSEYGLNLQTKPKYQTWFCGSTDKQYETLEEAIERMEYLMPIVERQSHWEDIAFVTNEEHRCKLHERKGIGGETLMALLDRFITLDGLREATIEDIGTAKGIGPDKAWLIADHLHPNVRYHELWDPNEEKWISVYRVPREIIDQCVRTRTYMTQAIRNKYRLQDREIEERGLVKVRPEEAEGQ